jgi:heme/copper-type cytochrome/quinol oxidase subunit 2
LLSHEVNDIIDKILLTVPLVVAVAVAYFVYVWKPRQFDVDRVERGEIVFWSSTLTILVLLAVYAFFFRH